jgi:hypothetical protein
MARCHCGFKLAHFPVSVSGKRTKVTAVASIQNGLFFCNFAENLKSHQGSRLFQIIAPHENNKIRNGSGIHSEGKKCMRMNGG